MPEIAQTADHALRILEELGKGEPLTASELGQRLDLSRTVVHRLLSTLAARAFVLRRGDEYRPGVAILRLASSIEPALLRGAGPVLSELSARANESMVLQVVDNLESVVLAQSVAEQHVVQVSHRVGSRASLTTGAGGRVLLAHLPRDVANRLARAENLPASFAGTLRRIREQRFAVSHDELQQGVHGIAVPVLGPGGRILASLAMIVPSARAGGIELQIPELWRAASAIEDEFVTSAPE